MLPSVVSQEVISAIKQQLSAQFPSTTEEFTRDGTSIVEQLFDRPNAIFKGPYLSFGLPFRKAPTGQTLPFKSVELPYTPYLHQMRAFQRLTGSSPQPTLVATGTGSGKTECFMYPLLEHCANSNAQGVKALIIYPMNALAQDQARRFAKEIYHQEKIKGKVSVGLYTGESRLGNKAMTEDSVIQNRDELQKNPPDILLTNYKMLDFLLLRPKDRNLWLYNDPGRLKYLVVDELHTFDGAQGTDLACLIRRLRDRLGCGDDMACVGTSATVGDDVEALTLYASNVFDTRFREDSILREERLTPAEFLLSANEAGINEIAWPGADDVEQFVVKQLPHNKSWLSDAAELWLQDSQLLNNPTALGAAMLRLKPFGELLTLACDIANVNAIAERWRQRWAVSLSDALLALNALVSLAAHARDSSGTQPLVTIREQLWLRELRRMVATVSDEPQLLFRDDLIEDSAVQNHLLHEDTNSGMPAITLPVIHCNVCHSTGWLSYRSPQKPKLECNIQTIYESFFSANPDTVVLYPATHQPVTRQVLEYLLCNSCGTLNSNQQETTQCGGCGATADAFIHVVKPDMNRERQRQGRSVLQFSNECPYCESSGSLFILGSRAATLSSVAINQLFNSQFNDDAKLIAFSDSVQDAAHRAGFFGARTYRDVVRAALLKSIDSGRFQNFDELCAHFAQDWRDRLQSDINPDATFIATFLAPDLAWLQDWEELQQTDKVPADSDLATFWVSNRLEWEALLALGLQARSGRSLERTLQAICYFPVKQIQQWAQDAIKTLQEEIAELRSLDSCTLQQFITGLLWRMRTRGAFNHDILQSYINSGGNVYQFCINNRYNRFLPRYGNHATLPAFLSLQKITNRGQSRFDSVILRSGHSWYQHWFNRILGTDNPLATASLEQAYQIVLTAGLRAGVIEEHDYHDQSIWSLVPSAWLLSTDITQLVCNTCGYHVQAATEERESWDNLLCMRSTCNGRLVETDSIKAADAHTARGDRPVRLIPAEHTAMLDSDTRAHTEVTFKRHPPKAWDVNLLSATPTMEMGVDIGDLSSVLLCSVPPAQANYLQRIGRAGRRDGNAFNLTIANGAPHDLYFYAEPLEMMRGAVQPPGVFLDAIAVLERQLLAYCMDRWVQEGIADDAVPQKLKVALDALDTGSDKEFPHNLLDFIDRNSGTLLRDFEYLFKPLSGTRRASTDSRLYRGLSDSGASRLKDCLQGSYDTGRSGVKPITTRLVQLFEDKAAQRKRLRRDIDNLKRDIQKLEKQPEDESTENALQELHSERGAIQHLVRTINRTDTLNFLTDAGVLPNYAFPEEGVTLNSIIYRRKETKQSDSEDKTEWENIELEIRRPAHAALKELAPHSRFYGNSRQVQIDQVMIDSDSVQTWRLCAVCNYGEQIITGDAHSVCPRCGDASWQASEQKMTMLRLKEVYANASDRDSRIGDDSDDREPVFYNRQSLFDMDRGNIQRGWRFTAPDCPFGFEYLSTASFREINFGRDTDPGQTISIAGERSNRAGFPVCRYCGKVRMWRPGNQHNHTRRCPMFSEDEETQKLPENLYTALYLFRELQSEAVRILLPIAEIANSDRRLQSLIAALHMGLQLHFRGNVDHLQITYVSEPVSGSQLRRHYLVLFDNVPGGTGYLDELTHDEGTLFTLMEAALVHMENCGCQHNAATPDGCYRCLYAYRDSFNLSKTSRRSAIESIRFILANRDTLEELEHGDELGHTDVNRLFDSELERLFIDVLASSRRGNLERTRMGNKEGYILNLLPPASDSKAETQSSRQLRWSIEPQVDLNESQGIVEACRPDFVIRCLSLSEQDALPVALFLDGFEFHRHSVAADTAKRASLMQSGKYVVWTLVWDDLQIGEINRDTLLADWFDQPSELGKAVIDRVYKPIASQLGIPDYGNLSSTGNRAPFDTLLDYLSAPQFVSDLLYQWSVSRIFGLVSHDNISGTTQQAGTWLPVPWQDAHLSDDGLAGLTTLSEVPKVTSAGVIKRAALGQLTEHASSQTPQLLPSKLAISLCLELDDNSPEHEDFILAWQRFWAASNLLQFAPAFLPVSRSGIESKVYAPIIEYYQTSRHNIIRDSAPELALSEAQQQALAYTVYPEELATLLSSDIATPEVGGEVFDSDRIIATLEWQWVDQKVGFWDGSDDDSKELTDVRGLEWRVVTSCSEEDLNKLRQWLANTADGES
jgi:DEAD/DEAH box helicase domain-containing protein